MGDTATATNIKKFRIALCLSQQAFAAELDITIQSISLYERGHREPSFTTIRKMLNLAKKHGLDLKLEDIRTLS